jgi:hypothetical protein
VNKRPARFPTALPEFFIKLLTEPGDHVLDPFAGSNTTGEAAESLGRLRLFWSLCPMPCSLPNVRLADEDIAAFVTAARGGTDEPLTVLPAQKALF